ncbi:DNA gyrase inhibitor YacG [bacterium]|nr:DNA gyrase inhibitor YacG [bacterium]
MKGKIKCPICKNAGDWFLGKFGPFCSERCKMVDLGKWLGEENLISGPLRPEHFDGYDELPPGDYLDRTGL